MPVPEFTNTEVKGCDFEKVPPPEFKFSEPKKLKVGATCCVGDWGVQDFTVNGLFYGTSDFLLNLIAAKAETTITVHFHEPFFLMSGVGMVYRVVAKPVQFTGYLSEFKPNGMDENGNPTATITVTPTEEPREA